MIIKLADYLSVRKKIALRNKRNLINKIIILHRFEFGIASFKTAEMLVEAWRRLGFITPLYRLKKTNERT